MGSVNKEVFAFLGKGDTIFEPSKFAVTLFACFYSYIDKLE